MGLENIAHMCDFFKWNFYWTV